MPYYTTPTLLAQGLENFSYEGGMQRKDFGLSNSIQKGKATQQVNFSSPSNTPLGWGYRANLIKSDTINYDL